MKKIFPAQANSEIKHPHPGFVMKHLKIVLAILVSGFFLWFSVSKVEWDKIKLALLHIQPVWLLVYALLMSLAVALRGWRWYVALNRNHNPGFMNTFWCTWIGYMGNNIFPGRAGELLRAIYLGRASGLRKSLVLATALIERIIDAGILLLLALVMLSLIPILPEKIRASFLIVLPFFLLAILMVMTAPLYEKLIHRILKIIPINQSIKDRIISLLEGLLSGVKVFYHYKTLIPFLLITFVIWSLDSLAFMSLASSFSSTLQFSQSLVFIAALAFASSLPSTPGYVGVYQSVAVTILPFFLIEVNTAFLIVTMHQAVFLLVSVIMGGTGFMKLRKKRPLPDE